MMIPHMHHQNFLQMQRRHCLGRLLDQWHLYCREQWLEPRTIWMHSRIPMVPFEQRLWTHQEDWIHCPKNIHLDIDKHCFKRQERKKQQQTMRSSRQKNWEKKTSYLSTKADRWKSAETNEWDDEKERKSGKKRSKRMKLGRNKEDKNRTSNVLYLEHPGCLV